MNKDMLPETQPRSIHSEVPSLNTPLHIASDDHFFDAAYELQYRGRSNRWDLLYKHIAKFHVDNIANGERINAALGYSETTDNFCIWLEHIEVASQDILESGLRLLIDLVANVTKYDLRDRIDDLTSFLRPGVIRHMERLDGMTIDYFREEGRDRISLRLQSDEHLDMSGFMDLLRRPPEVP